MLAAVMGCQVLDSHGGFLDLGFLKACWLALLSRQQDPGTCYSLQFAFFVPYLRSTGYSLEACIISIVISTYVSYTIPILLTAIAVICIASIEKYACEQWSINRYFSLRPGFRSLHFRLLEANSKPVL